MSKLIKQSTTQMGFMFLSVLSSDHITGNTANTPTVTISKNGAAFAAAAGAVSSLGNGWWITAANATDTNTLGSIALHATATSSDPTDISDWQIVPWDPQASLYAQTQQQQMTESYAAHNVVPTMEQANNMMLSILSAFSQAGATLTALKRDNTTTSMTLTFNNSSNASGVTQTGP